VSTSPAGADRYQEAPGVDGGVGSTWQEQAWPSQDLTEQAQTGQAQTGQAQTGKTQGDQVAAEQSHVDQVEQPARGRNKRRRTVLWAAVGTAVVMAVLIAVIASARPSSQVTGNSPLLGDAAPSIAGPGLANGHYSLAEFRHEWVLVNFMATWCGPCQQEMPQLLIFAKQHAATADATVLTVAYDPTNVSDLKSFLQERGAHWPAVNDPSASVSYGVTGLPSSFLVAPGGIVYAYVPGEVKAAELDRWLAQGAAKGLGPA
jgi:cytochrome c biogenesis protein CcmG, thiol:disulfide interchange protein DsbE